MNEIEVHIELDGATHRAGTLRVQARSVGTAADSARPAEERNSIPWVWLYGLCGLSAEASVPGWAARVTPDEARIAAAYATIELNGFAPHDSPSFSLSHILRRFGPIPYQIRIILGWIGGMDMATADLRDGGRLKDIHAFIDGLYDHDLHAKRVDSLAAATLGVMTGASLAVAMIGQALAQARGLRTKHAIKQVDRLLSNKGIDVWGSFARWVPHLIGTREAVSVAMDWTDFDGDDQATLAFNLVTDHGRAMPLMWLSVWKDELKTQRNAFEDACLLRLSQLVPPGCRVTILADRGFGDHKLFAHLADLGFGYVIRFRGNTHVTDASGETRTAAEWVGKSGRARKLRAARVTASHAQQVGAVVCVHARDMKEPWCLAASDAEAPAGNLIKQYARRWTIDIDQPWRLSRFKVGLIGVPRRWRQAAPGWGRSPDRLQIGDRGGVGGHQLCHAGAGFDRAAA